MRLTGLVLMVFTLGCASSPPPDARESATQATAPLETSVAPSTVRSTAAMPSIAAPPRAPALPAVVAVVWDEPASRKGAMERASAVRSIARNFMWVTHEYPRVIGDEVVMGFCREDQVEQALGPLRILRPAITTRADIAQPSDRAVPNICPDGRGVELAAEQSVKVGKLTLTGIAVRIKAPSSPVFVRKSRVSYHAMLRDESGIIASWAGDNENFLEREAPQLKALGDGLEILERCKDEVLPGFVGRARTRHLLRVAGRSVSAEKTYVDKGCQPE